MNLRHLQFFIELAKTQHMAKAAEALGISQPSLSYAINSLEQELKVPLFEKDGRNIKLTNYGQIYLQYVEASLNTLNEGNEYINELLDVNNGHINIGFTFTMGQDIVPRLITAFKKEPKKKNISFSYFQGTTSELIDQLLDDKLDIVLSSMPPLQSREQLNIRHLLNQELLVAIPNEYPFKNNTTISLSELAKYPFILYSKNSGLRSDIDRLLSAAKVKPRIQFESLEDNSIIGFVHYNFGIAIIPHLPNLVNDRVKLLHLSDKQNWHRLYCITRANHFLAPSAASFQDFIQKYCRFNYLDQNRLI
ncbi:DNA-binding transcriptional LysR family regulator [Lactobacillus colini]|uniref:DNA-binding transcriptional LysR family regulator n=1 Tax=Lactobacillus colini TaxID=1819254 RepID=A0ABS4MB64_9LACO|nr:LysR family transcriptional regulator [Lactobacillus colini]MBP2056878.1 DNA-binding transcriptional LysR family regulator [Lactobacillus colini]